MYFLPSFCCRNIASHTEVTVRTLKTHGHKPVGTLTSKDRQNIASIDLLLHIFYDVLMLWACPRGVLEREEKGQRDSPLALSQEH